MCIKSGIWLVLLGLLVGCGDPLSPGNETDAVWSIDAPLTDALPVDALPVDAPTADPDAAPIGPTNWRDILRDPSELLQRRIDAAFVGINTDTCFLDSEDVSNCARDTFAAGPAYVDAVFDQREAVLITDFLAPSVEMLRYRNRVLGFYTVQGDGTIDSTPMSWELPQVFGEIVTGFASAPAIPSESFDELLPRLQEVYGQSVPVVGTHGLAVFNIIADLIPQTPIVFLDINRLTFHQSIPDVVCAIGEQGGEVDVEPLRAHAQRFAQDLRALFAAHQIRFINASWGYTIETVRGPWSRVCGSEPPSDDVLRQILAAYQPIFDALFNTEGVFAAHASLASPSAADAPFDQYDPIGFPNRLRVGVFQYPGVDVPPEGQTTVPGEWFPEPNADYADVWVNSGCDYFMGCREQRPLSLTLQYGMGRSDFALAQSSFVSPILLGMFVHFRNQMLAETMDDSLIEDLIDTVIPECAFGLNTDCRYIDPLLHGQLDRYAPSMAQ